LAGIQEVGKDRGQVFDFSKLAGIELDSRTKLDPANSEKPNT
jgi:hypothetical protein